MSLQCNMLTMTPTRARCVCTAFMDSPGGAHQSRGNIITPLDQHGEPIVVCEVCVDMHSPLLPAAWELVQRPPQRRLSHLLPAVAALLPLALSSKPCQEASVCRRAQHLRCWFCRLRSYCRCRSAASIHIAMFPPPALPRCPGLPASHMPPMQERCQQHSSTSNKEPLVNYAVAVAC